MAPLVATTLIRETGQPTAPAAFVAGAALLALSGSFGIARRGGHVIGGRTKRPATR